MPNTQAYASITNSNSFAIAGEENHGADFFKKRHEDLKDGWSFQGKKKHIQKLASPRQEPS